jgi:ribosomal subunit interface protein
MEIPLQISFRNMESSPSIEARIREKVAKLERFSQRIIGCHVTVEAPHQRHRNGKLYNLRVDVTVPGQEIVAERTGRKDHAHEDIYVAMRDAFNAVVRQLQDREREVRGQVKEHEPPLHGKVGALYADHGFVETSDGLEIYFHQNSVVEGGFNRLSIGDEVRLVIAEDESEKGPQATTIKPVGKHHIAS